MITYQRQESLKMRIGVLTGGGDCPGLNAAIRGVTTRAIQNNDAVIGILNGWAGVLEQRYRPLTLADVAEILPTGGTILGSSRTNPAKITQGMERALEGIAAMQLDSLIAIGGDDTLGVAAKLYQIGVPVVGIPKTMDNDINGCDYCIGFDTAVSVVTEAMDRLRTTAASHHRVMVVEVMGRDAGWVATIGGLAGGADYILIPEVPVAIEEVCQALQRQRAAGKEYSLIVVSEGAQIAGVATQGDEAISHRDAFGHVRLDKRGIGERLADSIEERTGLETRSVTLGHLQRGGSPSTFDRRLGLALGVAAVELVYRREFGKMPAFQGNRIVTITLAEAVARTQTVDTALYRLAHVFFAS
jgi:phosphofructokinase-like protein